jgi:hypothetical protein
MNIHDLEEAKKKLAEASALTEKLREMLKEAQMKECDAHREVERMTRYSIEPLDKDLTVDALRERIADFAREHRTGETDTPWIMFRAALAELSRRAGAK